MHLEVTTTQMALTAGEPWSEGAIAARSTRGSGQFLSPTPDDLLSRAQHADANAVSDLLGQYGDAIRSFLRSRGAREDEASDVTQGTLIGMWRGLGRFRREKPGAFRAWLCTIAMNQLFNFRRTQAKVERLQEPLAPVELERQLAASQAQCCEREARRRRAFEITDRVWQRVAELFREEGEQVLFDYLYDSIHADVTAGDADVSRELHYSHGYVAKRRHDLPKGEYEKALRAEYRHLHYSKPQGLTPPPSYQEWARALLDDLG